MGATCELLAAAVAAAATAATGSSQGKLSGNGKRTVENGCQSRRCEQAIMRAANKCKMMMHRTEEEQQTGDRPASWLLILIQPPSAAHRAHLRRQSVRVGPLTLARMLFLPGHKLAPRQARTKLACSSFTWLTGGRFYTTLRLETSKRASKQASKRARRARARVKGRENLNAQRGGARF